MFPSCAHIAHIDGSVVHFHLLHGGPRAGAAWGENSLRRGLGAPQQPLKSGTSHLWLVALLGVLEGLTAACQANAPCERPFPSSSSQPIWIYRGGRGLGATCLRTWGTHPPPRERVLPAPTCLWTQQLPGQHGPRSLLFSCRTLSPGWLWPLGLLHGLQLPFDGLKLLPAHSPRLSHKAKSPRLLWREDRGGQA